MTMRATKEWALNIVTCLVTLLAVVVVWQRFHQHAAPTSALAAPSHVEAWRSYAQAGHRTGPVQAPVTVTVFSDYQCPYCKALEADLTKAQGKWPNDLAVIYRHFPLAFHAKAHDAAVAAECASRQNSFEAYHHVLFEEQDSLAVRTWANLAERAHVLDVTAFTTCMTDASVNAIIAKDSADGSRLGVTGTPTLLVNDLKFVGAPGLDTLEAYITRELRSARARRTARR
jgi:protein-disulfide isomerase